jgi:hypothetical protein
LNLDLSESSQICAQSLFVRSKPSPARTWSLKWKRDSWTRHLFGRILRPSLGPSFVTAWTSSLEVIHASHSQPQESDSVKTTQDIYGLGSQMEFDLCDQKYVSSRTSKDTSVSDSEMLSKNWQALVTKRRGEYSQRVKSARLTRENAYSSWPTCTDRDWKGTSPNYLFRKDGTTRTSQLVVVVDLEERNAWPTPTVQEAGKIGNQANNGQLGLSNHPAIQGECKREKFAKGKHGQVVQDKNSTDGSRQESWRTPSVAEEKNQNTSTQIYLQNQVGATPKAWATPRAGKTTDENPETWAARQANGDVATMPLTAQVKAWATPRAEMDSGAHRGRPDTLHSQIKDQSSGKLNPRWVETLMGLPVGWTMPSCTNPVIIAQTSCGS